MKEVLKDITDAEKWSQNEIRSEEMEKKEVTRLVSGSNSDPVNQ